MMYLVMTIPISLRENRLKSGNLSSTRRIVQKLWLDDSKFCTKWFAIIGTSDYEGRCKVLRGKGGQAWRA